MKAKTHTQILLLTLAFVATASVGVAQESVTLETIKVKGTKEEKSYFTSPESVAILQENELPATGRENNIQILNAVPNVEVNKNGDSFSIRGINNTGVTGYQKDNLSSVIIDDLFQTDLAIQAGSFDLWDMERVEILRGAQSTSQGVNSLAGTVLLDHRKPQLLTEGAAKFALGSFWHREAGAVTNSVLVEDRLASRISYNKEMDDGFIKNTATGNENWGRWNRDRANVSLMYRLSDSDQLGLTGKFNRNAQGGTYTQGANAFDYEVNEDQDYKSATRNYQLIGNYSKSFNDRWSNVTVLGFSDSHQDVSSDADGTSRNTAGTRYEDHDDRYLTVESRLHYRGSRVENLLGLHTHDFKLVDDYDFVLLYSPPATPGVVVPVDIRQKVDRTRRAYSVFDSFTYRLSEQHSLIAGLRGEFVHLTYDTDVLGTRLQDLGSSNAALDAYLSRVSGAYGGKRSNFVILPKLGYTFSSERHFAGVSYTRGYRTAGVSINRRRTIAVEYDPEFTNNYELSYKYSGQGFQLGSNLFYIDWRDQQVQVQLSNDFFDSQVQNAAKSRVYGAEVEGRVSLTTSQVLTAGVGYADTQFLTFQTRDTNYAGKKFPFASNWTGRVSHEFRLNDRLSFLNVLRYLSSSYSNAENTRRSDAQFYWNINSRYAWNAWMIEGYVNNVLNGQYRIFDGTPTSTTSAYQSSYHQTSTPRELGARVTYFW